MILFPYQSVKDYSLFQFCVVAAHTLPNSFSCGTQKVSGINICLLEFFIFVKPKNNKNIPTGKCYSYLYLINIH